MARTHRYHYKLQISKMPKSSKKWWLACYIVKNDARISYSACHTLCAFFLSNKIKAVENKLN